ncbi:MAG TPA: hypothetical protein ENH94_11105 [Phycisphaerales bacterium]|nr:hypothetical protein [Phycisphaerales bacterium]
MKKMTIRDAKKMYTTYGYQLFGDEIRALSSQDPDSCNQKISNSNYLHALFLTAFMFDNTSWSLDMLTGGNDGFLETLATKFYQALDRIKQNSGKARIIVTSENKTQFLTDTEKKYDNLEVFCLPSSCPENKEHFIVCDSLMVRAEEPHMAITDESDADVIRATVHINNCDEGKVFSVKFNDFWTLLQ